jgi:hypothetical protein
MRNNAIVERWNSGFLMEKFILNVIVRMNFAISPILHYPKTHFSNIPALHHSNWGGAPDLLR